MCAGRSHPLARPLGGFSIPSSVQPCSAASTAPYTRSFFLIDPYPRRSPHLPAITVITACFRRRRADRVRAPIALNPAGRRRTAPGSDPLRRNPRRRGRGDRAPGSRRAGGRGAQKLARCSSRRYSAPTSGKLAADCGLLAPAAEAPVSRVACDPPLLPPSPSPRLSYCARRACLRLTFLLSPHCSRLARSCLRPALEDLASLSLVEGAGFGATSAAIS